MLEVSTVGTRTLQNSGMAFITQLYVDYLNIGVAALWWIRKPSTWLRMFE